MALEFEGTVDGVTAYVNDILACYSELCSFPNLEPSPEVNQAFEKLVSLCSWVTREADTTKILTDPKIVAIAPRLQQLCADGEYQLELQWAQKIGACKTSCEADEILRAFPYHTNYIELIRMELHALEAANVAGCNLRRFAIIGSGPLPLTSLSVFEYFNNQDEPIDCFNIDRCPEAITSSKDVCRALGHTEKTMRFQCTDACDPETGLGHADVVFLAALVGTCREEKRDIVVDITSRMKPGALIVLRSAHSLRQLMYPAVKIASNMGFNRLKPLLVVHPFTSVLNSAIIAVVEEADGG